MAPQSLSESDDEYHSLSGAEPDDDDEGNEAGELEDPPVHPLASLQGPFEESIHESALAAEEQQQRRPASPTAPDAETRRKKLLERQQYDDSWTTRWKQRSTARYHPLFKLMAQIVFGMHLLHQQLAKSEAAVINIMQTHVDEVDGFLVKTGADFDLAIKDIDERARFLRLPMAHLDVLEGMLNEKKYRTDLLEGNEKIERIIERSAKAMNAALADVRRGIAATQELGKYLKSIRSDWAFDNPSFASVFRAMVGNEDAWTRCLRDLQMKGNRLGVALVQLGTVTGEMSKLVAVASRGNKSQSFSRPISESSAPQSSTLKSKFASPPLKRDATNSATEKPLPREPDLVDGAVRATIPKLHPVPFHTRFEQPRSNPQPPWIIAEARVERSKSQTRKPQTRFEKRYEIAKELSKEFESLASTERLGPKRTEPERPSIAGAARQIEEKTEQVSPSTSAQIDSMRRRESRESRTSEKIGAAQRAHSLSNGGPLNSHPPDQIQERPPYQCNAMDGVERSFSVQSEHASPSATDDSAYHSSSDKPAARGKTELSPTMRSSSNLTLFPKMAGPVTPPARNTQSNIKTTPSPTLERSATGTTRGKGSPFSIKNILHRKQKSSDVAA
ncbi:hypothetical protein LTR66_009978 [Elasticomyces elasticus]|nr:hypothetical protein LTR66_009978 [Elasticomyces elasticus]